MVPVHMIPDSEQRLTSKCNIAVNLLTNVSLKVHDLNIVPPFAFADVASPREPFPVGLEVTPEVVDESVVGGRLPTRAHDVDLLLRGCGGSPGCGSPWFFGCCAWNTA